MNAPLVSDLTWLDVALRAALVALMGWQVKTTQTLAEKVSRIDTALFGAMGDNGLNSEVRKLRDKHDQLRDDVTHLQARYGHD